MSLQVNTHGVLVKELVVPHLENTDSAQSDTTLKNNSAMWLGSNGVNTNLVLWQWWMLGSTPSYPDANKTSRNSNCMLSCSARNVTLGTHYFFSLSLGINKSGGSEEYFRKSSRTMSGNYSSHIRDVDKLLQCRVLSQQSHKVRTVEKQENFL